MVSRGPLADPEKGAGEKAEEDRSCASTRDRPTNQRTPGRTPVVSGGICGPMRCPPDLYWLGRERRAKPDNSSTDDVRTRVRPQGFGAVGRPRRPRRSPLARSTAAPELKNPISAGADHRAMRGIYRPYCRSISSKRLSRFLGQCGTRIILKPLLVARWRNRENVDMRSDGFVVL